MTVKPPSKFSAIIDAYQGAYLLFAADDRILETNNIANTMFGYTDTEFFQLSKKDIIDYDGPGFSAQLYNRKSASKASGEIIAIRKNGEKFHAMLTFTTFSDADTSEELTIALFTDLTETKKNDRLWEGIISVAKVGGWEYNVHSNELVWTEMTKEIHEVGKDFIPDIKKAISFYRDPTCRDLIRNSFKQLVNEAQPFDLKLNITTGKGNFKHIRAIGKAEQLNGVTLRVYGTFQDISAEVILAEKIRQSEAVFKGAFENSGIGMSIVAVDDTILQVNEALCNILGFSKEELLTLHFRDFTHPDELDTDKRYRFLLKEKKIDSFKREKRFITKKGILVWAYIAVSAIVDRADNLLYFVVQVEDISRNKQIEFELAKNEQEFRSLFDHNPDAVYSLNLDGIFTSMNSQLSVLLECPQKELRNKSFIPFCLHEDLGKIFTHFEEVKKGIAQTYEATAITSKGNIKNVIITNIPIIVNGTITGTYGIAKDISDRALSKKKLENALAELEKIMHFSLDIICVINDSGEFIQINQAATNIWGYTYYELIGKKYLDYIYEEDVVSTNRAASIVISGQGVSNFENRYMHKNGSVVNMSWSATWDSNANCMYAIGRDITEMKKREQERTALINELTQSNKDLKQFSYITSHNLRAPVTNLLALSQLINWHSITDDGNKMVLKSIEKSTQQLNNTINDLIKIIVLKEKREIPAKLISFEKVLRNVCASFSTIIEEQGVKLITDFSLAPEVVFNADYLESIFTNLISNAIKFRMPDTAPIINIKTCISPMYIELTFSDNGVGIDLDLHKNRIFKLFQTFHHHKENKGIGLYLIQSQLLAMGGYIDLKSAPGKGSSFTLYFKKI